MSRIGKEPVKLADGVTATVSGQTVTVKGKLGELSYTMHEGITAKVEDGSVVVSCADDKTLGAFHGLARALINNMAVGVSQGFQKQLSGRENIYLSGLLMGFSKQRIDRQIDEIIEFSELVSSIFPPINYLNLF